MSQAQTTQSLLKEYQKRLREDMRALRDNFQEIIMAAKGDEKLTDKLQLSHTTSAIYDKCQIQGKGEIGPIWQSFQSELQILCERART